MKVISGKYKGRNLLGFDLEGTRPTMDRVKESLFGMIQNHLSGSVVLDLFAGSGNLGIEALSEGAEFTYFCDYNKKAVQTIEKNLKNIGISNSKVLHMDYLKCIEHLSSKGVSFDFIFLDPPYDTNYLEKSIIKIIDSNLLKPSGFIICESNSLDKIIYPSCLSIWKEKKYGDKYVVLLQKM